MSVSIHEHEAVVTERDALRRERDYWKANHDNRVAAAKVLLDRPDIPFERVHAYRAYVALQEQVDALRQQLDKLAATANKWASAYAEKDADIERLYRAIDDNWVSHKQIVVSQLLVKQLREATECLLHLCEIIGAPEGAVLDKARHALATPTDATELQSMITKAGEVMRKRALVPCDDLSKNDGNSTECRAAAGLCGIAIDALPAITIDDLKGGA